MRSYLGGLFSLLLLLAIPGVAIAQPSDCSDGVVHDDGTFENGYGSNSIFFTHVVMLVEPQDLPLQLTSVCICWARVSPDSTVDFQILVWDSDGEDGAPGTLLGAVDAVASGVPTTLAGQFYRYDLSSLELNLRRPVYTSSSAPMRMALQRKGATSTLVFSQASFLQMPSSE